MKTISLERQFEITAYNARVVGTAYPPQQPFLCPPGLERTQSRNPEPQTPYANVFFGAEREWRNEEDGWQTVHRQKKRRSNRKSA